MFLVKFTDSIWKKAAIKGESIRIGSVLYYREIHDPTFRDEEEGEGSIVYKSKVPLNAETHNRIFIDEGYKLNEGWTIDTAGCPLISQKSIFNPFIYSCSLVRRKSDISKIAKKFNKKSWYFIGDVWKFVEQVSVGLRNHIIKEAELNPDITMPDVVRKKLQQLEMLPVIGKIDYIDDAKHRIVTETNANSFNPRTFELKSYFRKPTAFAEEQEFRMIWLPNLGCMAKDDFDLMNTSIRTIDLSISDYGISSCQKSIKEILNKRGERIV